MSEILTFDGVRYTLIWRIPAYYQGNPVGGSIGLARCELCGASVMFDPDDPVMEFDDPMTAHSAWHKKHGDIK